jgi:hypothetical protein
VPSVPRPLPLANPTVSQLEHAHAVYERREDRAYAYRAPRCLLEQATGTEAEAVRLLLHSWNQRVGFDKRDLGAVLRTTAARRSRVGDRFLESLTEKDRGTAESIFAGFAGALGPVGAAKALGLLHPTVFVMWDTEIARQYCGSTWRRKVAATYGRFMSITAMQVRACHGGRERFEEQLLKVIDERNYCCHTKCWISR